MKIPNIKPSCTFQPTVFRSDTAGIKFSILALGYSAKYSIVWSFGRADDWPKLEMFAPPDNMLQHIAIT